MQYTQQTAGAEFVTNNVWGLMNHVRGNMSLEEFFIPSLAILYAIHKGYNIHVFDSHRVEFEPKEDKLYKDLLSLIPNDIHLHSAMCIFINELDHIIDKKQFNSIYVEVLKGLFDLVSCNSGKDSEDFFTPSAITKLMAHIVNSENCNDMFDPFCGTASIIHEFSKTGGTPLFIGQEINYKTFIYARINAEAVFGCDEGISNVNSISHWDDCTYDAVVSCPPLGLFLSKEQLCAARYATPDCPCRTYNEILLVRPLISNHAKLTVTLLPMGFCFTRKDHELRRYLIEQNLVDTIIALPANILYGTSIPTIILICKRERQIDEPIKIIHAEKYYNGDRRKRVFDVERCIDMMESFGKDCVKILPNEVREYDYNLNPSLYFNQDFDLQEGQQIVQLGDLITPAEGKSISSNEIGEATAISSLSKDYLEILLNNSKVSIMDETRKPANYLHLDANNKKYLLAFTSLTEAKYGLFTDNKSFNCPSAIKVFEINESLVNPKYLAYILVNNEAISKSGMALTGYMKFPVVIDSLDKQVEIINKITQRYHKRISAENEADAKRLGIKQNISDLEHMLGTTQIRIGKIIQRLEKATPADGNYMLLVKQLKDNVEYMNRTIQYTNARIDSASFNMQSNNITEFINEYVDAWNNYGSNCFTLEILSKLDGTPAISFDKSMMTVMLDSILNNAVRHGFHKRKKDGNQVLIRLSEVNYKENPYLLLSIANNGEAITDGFTVEDYVSRGRFTASTGRSGLGGYHVFQIVKGHKGYLRLDSNKMWNVIVDVLIPINSANVNDLADYDYECI